MVGISTGRGQLFQVRALTSILTQITALVPRLSWPAQALVAMAVRHSMHLSMARTVRMADIFIVFPTRARRTMAQRQLMSAVRAATGAAPQQRVERWR